MKKNTLQNIGVIAAIIALLIALTFAAIVIKLMFFP